MMSRIIYIIILIILILSAFIIYFIWFRTGNFIGGNESDQKHHNPVEVAMNNYISRLSEKSSIPYDLVKSRIPKLSKDVIRLGGANTKIITIKKNGKKWNEYDTWIDLAKDKDALTQYIELKSQILSNPDLDWSLVLKEIGPKLNDRCEYVGLIDLSADGHTLKVSAYESSPIEISNESPEITLAGVPAELVDKYAEKPALFFFHTHPKDPLSSNFPSSVDLSVSISYSLLGRYAASCIISSYGVFLYGLDWDGYRMVHESDDPILAKYNLIHDVVSAHESIRSWRPYSIQDYIDFYPKYQMFMIVYPSSEMVGDNRHYQFSNLITAPIDYDLIETYKKSSKRRSSKRMGSLMTRNYGKKI